MVDGASCRIGEWSFHPASNELRRGEERRRLEDRAARTLALLCANRGEPVSQEAIISEVWNGRSQSANSLPVVIGQIRRAIGDEARNPRFIETVPKRGYRLVEEAAVDRAGKKPWLLVLALLALLVVAAAAFSLREAPPQLVVEDVVNETGDPGYDPLTRATSELVAAEISRHGIAYRRSNAPDAETRLTAKLVLWNREPTVSLTAMGADGAVLWSGMARGPVEALPGNVIGALGDFRRETGADRAD